ncbi:MAG TPA: LysM peptidoglycan-binding domain-containing protein [Ardenticatenaceae bacterium]|nr:LysM peptidoglycan-binding domain-containing protein [Ardenticatenaceae bacterium]
MLRLRPALYSVYAVALVVLALLATTQTTAAAPQPILSQTESVQYSPPHRPPSQGGRVHIVQRGETLGMIAARYDTSVSALIEANGIANPDVLHPGQEIVIPPGLAPTYDNIVAYFNQVFAPLGARAQQWALRVAWCESRYNVYAVNRRGNWHGLFQYHPQTWAEFSSADIYDWQAQVRVTSKLYSWGQTWRWACK